MTLPRRTLAFCLLHVAFCISITACAPASRPASEAPTASAAAVAPSSLPVPAATPLPRLPTAIPPPTATPAPQALTLWVAEDGPGLAAVRALLGELVGEDIGPVELIARPADGLRLSLATAALVGEAEPDLIWADQEALAGLLADGLIQPVGGQAAPDTLPALVAAATADGELWGAPLTAQGALLLLSNRALVPAAPTSSVALIAAARAAATPDTAGLVMAWEESRWLLPWLYAYGGAPLSADGATITLDTPELAAALGFLRELHAAAEDDTVSYQAGQRLFGRGNAAYAIDGDWAIAGYTAMSDTLELSIAPLPVVPATGRAAVAPLGGTYLMLHRDLAGEERGRAIALIDALSAPEAQARLALALGRLPARQAALADPMLATSPALVAAAARAANAPGLPPTPAARCALYGIDVWLPSVLAGTREIAEAATSMQREAEACLARAAP